MKWSLFGFGFLALYATVVLSADCEGNGYSLRIGQSYQRRGQCWKRTCVEPNNVVQKNCQPLPRLGPNCDVFPQDLSKKFPACCPEFQCRG